MIGRAKVLQHGVLVILRMRRGKISAVEIQIVFLFAVIRQRLSGNLPSGNSPPIGEYRKKERIHASALLQHIQHFLCAFIDKRDGPDLNADGFRRSNRGC